MWLYIRTSGRMVQVRSRDYIRTSGRVMQVRSRDCTAVPVVVWCRLDHVAAHLLVRLVCTAVTRTFAL
jgi:hypothetical protein